MKTIWECIWEKGPIGNFSHHEYDVKCGTCLHKSDCRETTLSHAAKHFKIFLIEFRYVCINICTSCTLGIPNSQLLSLFPCYGSLKLTCFIQKIVSNRIKHQKVQ